MPEGRPYGHKITHIKNEHSNTAPAVGEAIQCKPFITEVYKADHHGANKRQAFWTFSFAQIHFASGFKMIMKNVFSHIEKDLTLDRLLKCHQREEYQRLQKAREGGRSYKRPPTQRTRTSGPC